jgi:hypothetical protein
VVFNMPRGFSIVADLTAVHAGSVSGTTQSITVFNYLFGPRYTFRNVSRRFLPYEQALGGGSQELSSYTAVQNVLGAAFSFRWRRKHHSQPPFRLDHRRSGLDRVTLA